MKNIRLFAMLVCALFSLLPLQAERVSIEKAEKTARSYAGATPQLAARRNFQLSRTVSKPVKRNLPGVRTVRSQEEPMYYVFTLNGNDGFIIVSGDDVATPILGYSDTGTYDESNPNLAYWMETLAQEIAEAIETNLPQDAQTQAEWDALQSGTPISTRVSGDYVDPLVKTKWNQDAPYYNLCPTVSGTRTVTGCVATAMAQLMKYHEYPITRTVEIPGYTTGTRNIAIPAITGTTDYDWNNMTNIYSSSSTSTENNAVATLMYHCGVSVKMDYDTPAAGGSGAYSSDVLIALKTYFDYDDGINYLDRSYYSYTEWIDFLKTELRANRPVYYKGYSDGGGHAFVCDGYDTGDLFHFNWGWGGSSDGYFEVSALNPNSLGIGGGTGGYNQSQAIITGIQPNQGGGGVQPDIRLGLSTFSANETSLSNLTDSFDVTAGTLTNIGIVTIAEAYLGVLLCNQDDSFYAYQTAQDTMDLPPGYYYPSYTLLYGYKLPSDLPVGSYKLYPAFSLSAGIPSIIPGANGNRYITVVVAGNGSVTLSEGAVLPNLSLVSLITAGNIYHSKTGNFEAEITNSGSVDYNSLLNLKLGSQSMTEPAVIPAGTTKTIGFSGTITLAAGNYSMSLWYDPSNTTATPSVQLGNAVPVEVKATPSAPNLSLEGAPSFLNGSNAVPQNAPNLSVQIKNTGGLFDNTIQPFIFPESGGSSIASFGGINARIETGETKDLLFNNPIDFLEVGDTYLACIFYYNGGWVQLGSGFLFTVTAPLPPSSDATLKSLVVKDAQTQTPLTLTSVFTPAITAYTAVTNGQTTQISIIGEGNHPRAKFTNIENQTLNNEETDFEFNVTAEDGTTVKTYTIKVIKGPLLSGKPVISGTAVFGQTLTAQSGSLSSTPVVTLGALSYQWKRNDAIIDGATENTYTLVQEDISQTITVTVSAANCRGSATSDPTSTVAKASQNTPADPSAESVTETAITLNPISDNAQYSLDETTWQDSPVFSNLMPNTPYTFYARLKESATHEASPVSSAIISTQPAAITIISQPDSLTFTYGDISGNLNITSTVTGGATLSYQWYSNNVESNAGGTIIPDATTNSFILPTTLSAGTYYYYCVVNATYGATGITSDVAKITVNKRRPTISDLQFSPANAVYDGSAKSVTVSAKAGITGTGTVTVKYASGWAGFNAVKKVSDYLYLPAAGFRYSDGSLNNQGSYGNYWSSSAQSSKGWYMNFDRGSKTVSDIDRTAALSVRCVPE